VSFAAVTLRVASQRVFIIVVAYFVMTQSGNVWIYHRITIFFLLSSSTRNVLSSYALQ
jgi:hypothetical protein